MTHWSLQVKRKNSSFVQITLHDATNYHSQFLTKEILDGKCPYIFSKFS